MASTLDSIIQYLNQDDQRKCILVEDVLANPEFRNFLKGNKNLLLDDNTLLLDLIKTSYYPPLNKFTRNNLLTSIQLFREISLEEFQRALKSDYLKPENVNYNRYDRDHSILSSFVQFDVLKNTSHIQRLLTIIRWILTAQLLIEARDLHKPSAIIKGLLNKKVIRTVNLDYLPEEVSDVFQALKCLYDDKNGYTLLVNIFMTSSECNIPCHHTLQRKMLKLDSQIEAKIQLKKSYQKQITSVNHLFEKDYDQEDIIDNELNIENPHTEIEKQVNTVVKELPGCDEKIKLYSDQMHAVLQRIKDIQSRLPAIATPPSAMNSQNNISANSLLQILSEFKETLLLRHDKDDKSREKKFELFNKEVVNVRTKEELFALIEHTNLMEENDKRHLIEREMNYFSNQALLMPCIKALSNYYQRHDMDLQIADDALYQISYTLIRPNLKERGDYIEKIRCVSPDTYQWHPSDRKELDEISKMLCLTAHFNSEKIDELIKAGMPASPRKHSLSTTIKTKINNTLFGESQPLVLPNEPPQLSLVQEPSTAPKRASNEKRGILKQLKTTFFSQPEPEIMVFNPFYGKKIKAVTFKLDNPKDFVTRPDVPKPAL